jgi:hypothetical protein
MKILFYSDSVPIGGHELMSIRLANQLSYFDTFDVSFLAPETFSLKLNNNVKRIINNVAPRPLNGSFGHIFINDYFCLLKSIKTIKPDLIIVCQGTIELGIKAVVIAKLLGIKVVSYIPLVIDLLSTGSPFLPRLRNFLNDFLYMLPDGFVTISNYHRHELYKKVRFPPPISVLRNWVEHDDLSPKCLIIRDDISNWVQKQKLEHKVVILIIGRIEFKHKQQDKFLKLVCNGKLNANISILFAGSGSDSGELVSIIDKNRLSNVFYCGNVDEVHELYQIVDGVCICSSFEGVPLVMLESINWSLPVFSFDFEALRDYLPPSMLVPDQNFLSLIERINKYDFSNKICIYSSDYKEPSGNEIEVLCQQLKLIFNK